jgi:hypothetical protein
MRGLVGWGWKGSLLEGWGVVGVVEVGDNNGVLHGGGVLMCCSN